MSVPAVRREPTLDEPIHVTIVSSTVISISQDQVEGYKESVGEIVSRTYP